MSWGGNGSSWQYWRGTPNRGRKQQSDDYQTAPWKSSFSSKGNGKGKQKNMDKQAFPPFDQAKPALDQPAILEVASQNTGGGDPLISHLQRAVNQARKAEKKVQSIEREQLEKKHQWSQWQAQLKQSYAKEKARFLATMERLARDHAAATVEQSQARSALRSVTIEPKEVAHNPAQDMEFAALIQDADLQMEENDDMEDIIKRAKQAAVEERQGTCDPFATPMRKDRQLPSTPLGAQQHGYSLGCSAACSGPGVDSYLDRSRTSPAIADPYMCSPGPYAAGATTSAGSVHRTRRSPSSANVNKDGMGKREHIKMAGKAVQPVRATSPHTGLSLAEKLAAKRMESLTSEGDGRAAGSGREPIPVDAAPSPPRAPAAPQQHIIYDDSDISDLDQAEIAALQAQYAGLGGLE